MAVTHIVLIAWSTEDQQERDDVIAAVRDLPTLIPEIRGLRSGASTSPEGLEQGYDFGFVIDFDTAAARDSYLVHPAHVPVAEAIGRVSSRVLVFDL